MKLAINCKFLTAKKKFTSELLLFERLTNRDKQ